MYQFPLIEEDKELADHTNIEWLDQALGIADIITKILLEDGRLAESGKALVLKTSEANSYVGSNPTSSAK